MSASPARKVVLKALGAIRTRDAYAPEVLSAALDRSSLSAEDAAFATKLLYGTVQSTGTLDEVLDRNFTRSGAVEPAVRDALRMSAYELLFLGKPAHVAVDQGVELVKHVVPRAAGLANAVLRKVAADAETFPWGDPTTDVDALARATAHPPVLARRLVADLGFPDASTMMYADGEAAPTYVAVNPFLSTGEQVYGLLEAEGAAPELCGLAGCFEIKNPAALVAGRTLASGRVVVADACAQFIAAAAAPRPGDTFLEVGSGRGTKSLLLQAAALRAGGSANIHALDSHAFKASLLHERMQRLGVPSVVAHVGDARHPAQVQGLPASFDGALIDAPCSGTGTLRRHPDKRWRITEEDVSLLAGLGGELLAATASVIAPGGAIVYSTCSVLREENEDVVDAFLSSEAGGVWSLVPFATHVPAPLDAGMIVGDIFRSIPRVGGPDGHFAARLVKDR